VLVISLYVAILFHNPLELKKFPIAGHHTGISFFVVAVNPRNSDVGLTPFLNNIR
jgi:hypothetical protein